MILLYSIYPVSSLSISSLVNLSFKKEKKAIILIVDDVEANRFVLKEIIEDMDYQPMLTENGMQALRDTAKNRSCL